MKRLACLFSCTVGAWSADAQQATVQVTLNHSSGTVLPGETIRVNAAITWTEFMQWAGLKGDLLTTGDMGVAADIDSELSIYVGPLVSLGSPIGGSVKGVDIASIPGFFTATWPIPFGNWWGVEFLWFDWTAPSVTTPTTINFDFVADPIAPNVRLFPSGASPGWVEAQTTYLGTSIVVLPAPAGLAAMAVTACLAPRRRR